MVDTDYRHRNMFVNRNRNRVLGDYSHRDIAKSMMGVYAMSLGSRIRDLRVELGLTQGQLAKKAGVSQPTISTYENNPKTEYRAHILFKIAAALEVSPEYLQTGKGPINIRDAKSNMRSLVQAISELDEDQRALLLSIAKSMHKPKD